MVTDDDTHFTVKVPDGSSDGIRIIRVGSAMLDNGGQIPAHGDSGAPVVAPDTGDDVDLVGALFARDGNQFLFSKIGYIYLELGSSYTWDSCVSGC